MPIIRSIKELYWLDLVANSRRIEKFNGKTPNNDDGNNQKLETFINK